MKDVPIDDEILDQQYKTIQQDLVFHQLEHHTLTLRLKLKEIEKELFKQRERELRKEIERVQSLLQ
jgi:hypothetical protein